MKPLSLDSCNNCPRLCDADRSSGEGWCRADDSVRVASLVIHHGEEPPLSGQKGIVNLFFPSCNMHCVYCQNWEISQRGSQGILAGLEEVCDRIEELLPLSENNLGFVSPAHYVSQVKAVVEELHRRGLFPTIVYNTNGYELASSIASLEGIVDVWLPDFKYSDDELAVQLSGAPGYSACALTSLKAMMHQVGVTLQTDERGIARRGIIIRHLVLPGAPSNSTGVLKIVAEELSPNLHISLMSQYFPPDNPEMNSFISDPGPAYHYNPGNLLRTVTAEEYNTVIEAFTNYGFTRGWVQELESNRSYRPDFSRDEPFGN